MWLSLLACKCTKSLTHHPLTHTHSLTPHSLTLLLSLSLTHSSLPPIHTQHPLTLSLTPHPHTLSPLTPSHSLTPHSITLTHPSHSLTHHCRTGATVVLQTIKTNTRCVGRYTSLMATTKPNRWSLCCLCSILGIAIYYINLSL